MSDLTPEQLREACQPVIEQLREWAVERFGTYGGTYGPHDARGATYWDVAAWLDEVYCRDTFLTRFDREFDRLADQ